MINSSYAIDNNPNTIKVVILGDSLIAGYGLEEKDSFPSQLETTLQSQGYKISIANAGVSGDTSAGGLERLEWSLAGDSDILVIALGANDGLRGIDPTSTQKNLENIILQAGQLDPEMKIVLFGMLAPPNLGQEYSKKFNAIYPYLAEKYDVLLYPFFLENVVTDKNLNQADGIHPNQKGVKTIVDSILPFFKDVLEMPL